MSSQKIAFFINRLIGPSLNLHDLVVSDVRLLLEPFISLNLWNFARSTVIYLSPSK
jgi:hypothetical protein